MRITHSGFAFLLQDINAQIWTLLLQYLEHSTTLNMDPVDVLHFLFMLGSLELGQDYSTSMLTDTQHIMLEDLRDYGIVFQRKVLLPLPLSNSPGEITTILPNSTSDISYLRHNCSLIFSSERQSLRYIISRLHHPRNKLSIIRIHQLPSTNRHS